MIVECLVKRPLRLVERTAVVVECPHESDPNLLLHRPALIVVATNSQEQTQHRGPGRPLAPDDKELQRAMPLIGVWKACEQLRNLGPRKMDTLRVQHLDDLGDDARLERNVID